ncbi:hypothetical protein SAMN05444157_1496 [Frankineae bacterium MT45]|nr:hypothetical protein SAMN05444157_1496 [Frankineae bacterium MT45]
MYFIRLARSVVPGTSQRYLPDNLDRPADDGFTLIEVVVAFTLMVIIGAGVVASLVNGARATTASQQRAAASNIARQYLESARAQGLAVTPTTSWTAVPNTPYSYCRNLGSTTAAPSASTSTSCATNSDTGCNSTTAGQQYYISIVVRWSTPSGAKTLRSDTVMACNRS